MHTLLLVFIALKIFIHVIEVGLSLVNQWYVENPENQTHAQRELGITPGEFEKALFYTRDKHKFSLISGSSQFVGSLCFLSMGGYGWLEAVARGFGASLGGGEILVGLIFFGLLGALSGIFSLPFDLYFTFVVEQKHGFNRQTLKGFCIDQIKGLLLGAVLGGALLGGVLYLMGTLENWWFWAWAFMSVFSLLITVLYPSLIAPIFNKFSPLEEGDLKSQIMDLAKKIDFQTSGLFVMDASTRSSHGNAYFTGLFGAKRIVFFDTLLKDLNPKEIVAVLAHELGHFKLNHVRWGMARGLAVSFVMFYALGIMFPHGEFYEAFGFSGVSNFSGLLLFSMWSSVVGFFWSAVSSYLSRRHEFQADAFARSVLGGGADLIEALKKLRQSNHTMPIAHPLFSSVYYSHPPLLERIAALRC